MNKILALIMFLTISTLSYSQGKKGKPEKDETGSGKVLLQSYMFSRDLNDNSSARTAATGLYHETGAKNWLDTLSMLFLSADMHDSNIKLASQILNESPDNVFVRINKAHSEFAVDSVQNALEDISYAYNKTGRADLLFYKAYLECLTDVAGQCIASLDKLQNKPGYKELEVRVPFSYDAGTVPAEAGVLYLQAKVLAEQEQKEAALKLLNEALELDTEFKEALDLKSQLIQN